VVTSNIGPKDVGCQVIFIELIAPRDLSPPVSVSSLEFVSFATSLQFDLNSTPTQAGESDLLLNESEFVPANRLGPLCDRLNTSFITLVKSSFRMGKPSFASTSFPPHLEVSAALGGLSLSSCNVEEAGRVPDPQPAHE
jgi:hypothetical protein